MNREEPVRLPKTVFQLGWVSFFADICSEMVYPVIPLFLKHTLKASSLALGAVEGTAEAVVSIMKGWSGLHSDATGKRLPYVQWGYGLSAVGKPLMALAGAWWVVLATRVLDRIGKGVRTTARDALIIDAMPSKNSLGRAFGFHRGMDTAGALVGVLLCYFLLQFVRADYRTIFLLAAVPGIASMWLTFQVREKSLPPESAEKTRSARARIGSLPTPFWISVGLTCLFALANSSDTFLLRRASDLGMSDATVILAYASYNVTYMLVSYPAGILSDKIGRWWLLGAGWALYAGVYYGFGAVTASSLPMLWAMFGVYGVFMGATKGVMSALVADHAPKEARGTAMGIFNMFNGVATLVASLLIGLLWDQFGARIAFTVDAAIALGCAILLPVVLRLLRGR